MRIGLDPRAETRAAGEVDDRGVRMLDQRLPIGASMLSRHSVTRSGENPASASTSRQVRTASAIGRIAVGCGFTITALPVARLASMAGYAFQVGNVAQAKHTATPRGTSR